MPIGQTTLQELMPTIITVIVAFLLIALCIRMVIKTSKEKRARHLGIAQMPIIDGKQASLWATFPHTAGLDLPENTLCKVYSCESTYEFVANGIEFKLNKSKVHDVSLKTDVEIQKQYVSSTGGAVGGALLFGAAGAIIGGRAKKKKSKTVHYYMIITYSKDIGIDYIAFDVTKASYSANIFIKEFKSSPARAPKSMEL